MIDLASAIVRNSDPACLKFPVTATLHSFGLVPGEMRIQSSGAERWPAVAIDASGELTQAATLWVFLQINGRWYATGAERLRPTQVNGEKPEGEITGLIGRDWLFDAGRWQEMASYTFTEGKTFGVMLVAGDSRGVGRIPVQERSNVLELKWPGPQGRLPLEEVWREGQIVDVPTSPSPVPEVPSTPPTPSAPEADIVAILAQRLTHIEELLIEILATAALKIDAIPTTATGHVDIKYIGKAPVTLTLE